MNTKQGGRGEARRSAAARGPVRSSAYEAGSGQFRGIEGEHRQSGTCGAAARNRQGKGLVELGGSLSRFLSRDQLTPWFRC
jgi:hypothetical protein